MKKNVGVKTFKVIKEHIINNKKSYIIFFLLFIIGIFAGVFFINNLQEPAKSEITNYLNEFMTKFKEIQAANSLNQVELIKDSIIQNTVLAILLWFFGTTVIGIPVVFGIVLYRGFCLGYTISLCVSIMGTGKGIIFILSTLLLQNILFIPAILALAVSGFKLYKSIVKDKRKENIRIEILRHTIFSVIMLGVLIISSIIEGFMSTNLLKIIIKYF